MSAIPPGPSEPRERASRRPAASLAGSALGFAAALAAGPLVRLVPPSRQVAGFAALHGIDVRRELVRWALLVVLPILGGFAAGAVASRPRTGNDAPDAIRPDDDRPARLWPAAVGAHAVAAWIFAVFAVPQIVLRAPAFALILIAAASAGLALLLGRGRIEEGAAWLGSAALVLPLAFVGRRPLPLAAAAGVAAFALPAIARAAAPRRESAARFLRALTLAALVPGSVGALAAAAVLGTPPIADLFENGHELLPASEYLRGERPYRDIVPGHGLLSDGAIEAASLLAFRDDYGGFFRGRKLFGATFWPAFYAVGLGATGSPAVALGIALLSLTAFCQYAFLRLIGSFLALALALAASRTGSRRLWAAAGAALAVAFLLSVDFGVYAAAAAAAALWVSRGDRSVLLASAGAGAAAVAIPAILALTALGVLPEFARTTFGFVPSLLPAYAQGFPRPFGTDDPSVASAYAAGAAAVLLLGALLPLGRGLPDSARPLPPICAWIAFAMLAVLERRHMNYPYFAVPAGVVLLGRWVRRSPSDRVAANLAATALVGGFALAHGGAAAPRVLAQAIASPYLPTDVATLDAPRRAAGAAFRAPDRVLVARTAEMIERAGFREGDTWLDFANEPGLYFLFERPCPIRFYEVPFYESEEAQREVIAAVETNPRVRAVLLSGTYAPIDGVSSADRAPLVAAYIAESFRPFLREDGIEFWIRKDDPAGGAAARP